MRGTIQVMTPSIVTLDFDSLQQPGGYAKKIAFNVQGEELKIATDHQMCDSSYFLISTNRI